MSLELLTNYSEDSTKQNGQCNKGPIPVMIVMDRGNSKKHENDRFGGSAQHFHCVL